jgi:hypothetical protein
MERTPASRRNVFLIISLTIRYNGRERGCGEVGTLHTFAYYINSVLEIVLLLVVLLFFMTVLLVLYVASSIASEPAYCF